MDTMKILGMLAFSVILVAGLGEIGWRIFDIRERRAAERAAVKSVAVLEARRARETAAPVYGFAKRGGGPGEHCKRSASK
jgi:hypothetical protein